MKPCEECFVSDDQKRIMDEVREVINENEIGSRIGCALLMRIIYEEYRDNTTQEVYNRFLDKCKEYWGKD